MTHGKDRCVLSNGRVTRPNLISAACTLIKRSSFCMAQLGTPLIMVGGRMGSSHHGLRTSKIYDVSLRWFNPTVNISLIVDKSWSVPVGAGENEGLNWPPVDHTKSCTCGWVRTILFSAKCYMYPGFLLDTTILGNKVQRMDIIIKKKFKKNMGVYIIS